MPRVRKAELFDHRVGGRDQVVRHELGHQIFPIGQTTRYDPIGKVEMYKEKGALRERRTGDFIRFDRFEFTLPQSLGTSR